MNRLQVLGAAAIGTFGIIAGAGIAQSRTNAIPERAPAFQNIEAVIPKAIRADEFVRNEVQELAKHLKK